MFLNNNNLIKNKNQYNTSDPISNFLNELKIASKKNKIFIIFRYSKKINNLLQFLIRNGFILNYNFIDKNLFFIKINLKYNIINNKIIINDINIISKPGNRIYYNVKKLTKISKQNKEWIYAVSTSKQNIINQNEAIKYNLGGEVIFKIR